MDEMKKENIELRNSIHYRQDRSVDPDQISVTKPRPTSLYNIAQQYINTSSNSSMVFGGKYSSKGANELLSSLCIDINDYRIE